MHGYTGLFTAVTRPKYQDSVLIAYEGPNVGPIIIRDMSKSDIGATNFTTFVHGQVYVVDKGDYVLQSIQGGELKKFVDPSTYGGNPPLKVYRLSYTL